MNGIVLLNADYTYLNMLPLKKALKLISKKKAEIVKATGKVISSISMSIQIPKILRMAYHVDKLYKRDMPYSKRRMITRDNFTCQYCGIQSKKLTEDHVIPKDHGGKSSWTNCVAACNKCNNKKGNRTPEEAGMALLRKPFKPSVNDLQRIRNKNTGVDEIIKNIFK